jgi:CRP-like cAMP-binding protein
MFSRLTPEELTSIGASCRIVTLNKNEILFHRGEPSHGFFCVVAGQMELVVSSADGAEKVVELIGTGETFGEAVMFAERPYPVTAKALLRTELLRIDKDVVLGLLDRDPSFARRLLTSMALRQHQLVRDVEAYSLRSGTQRVVGFLLGEVDETGTALVLPTRKHVLASRLNLTPETLSRVLRELSEAGLIAVDGARITLLDVPGLERELGWT